MLLNKLMQILSTKINLIEYLKDKNLIPGLICCGKVMVLQQ